MTQFLAISFLTITLALPLITGAADASFAIKPFANGASTDEEIRAGLRLLYSHKEISAKDLEKRVNEAKKFQADIYKALEDGIKKSNGKWPVKMSSRVVSAGLATETTILFPSLIQRPGNHPTNTVVARLYEPVNHDRFCTEPLPTTIFLHHILNEVPMIEKAATVMASGVVSPDIAMAVLHMPLYGARSSQGEEFLTNDMKQFRTNISQTILDLHLLKNLLETLPRVRTEDMSLSGISLGSVMGLTMGAFDQSFHSYGFLVGGGDMANVLMNRVRTNPDSEVAIALKASSPTEESLRDELAAVDGMTWLHRYKNKDLLFVNANKDEVVNFENSVIPVVENLKIQGNNVLQRVNEGPHVPSGILPKLKNSFLPLVNYIAKDNKRFPKKCQEPLTGN